MIRHKTFLLHLSALGIGIIMQTILWFLIYQHLEHIKDSPDNFFFNTSFFYSCTQPADYVGHGIFWGILPKKLAVKPLAYN